MKKYLHEHSQLSSLQAKKLIIRFWKSLEPDYFKKSFKVVKGDIEMLKLQHLAFVRSNLNLDWSKVLFSKFGVVRCVSVWTAGMKTGPFRISISNGLLCEASYVQILDDVVLPFLMENRHVTYVQVRPIFQSNLITKITPSLHCLRSRMK